MRISSHSVVIATAIAIESSTTTAAAVPRPSLSLSLSNGDYDGIVDGLKPTLSWSGSASVSDTTDLEYGLETSPLADGLVAVVLPKTVFGSLKTRLGGGWGISAAGVVESKKEGGATTAAAIATSTSIGLRAFNDDADLSVEMEATTEGGVESVSASKGFGTTGGAFRISPKCSFGKSGGNGGGCYASVVVNYDSNNDNNNNEDEKGGATSVQLTASLDEQEVVVNKSLGGGATNIQLTTTTTTTISSSSSPLSSAEIVVDHSIETTGTDIKLTASRSHQRVALKQRIDKHNTIAPAFDSDGDLSVMWERSLDDGDNDNNNNSVTTVFRPDKSIDVEWKDDNWTANVSAGLTGTSIGGISVTTKRTVTF